MKRKFTTSPVQCGTSGRVRTYKNYSFYNKDGHMIIIDNASGLRYTLREIQPEDICCVISVWDNGSLVSPIEDNMFSIPDASSLGITDIIDQISNRLI